MSDEEPVRAEQIETAEAVTEKADSGFELGMSATAYAEVLVLLGSMGYKFSASELVALGSVQAMNAALAEGFC